MAYPRMPQKGEIWRHHNGGVYQVFGMSRHEGDGRLMVQYVPMSSGPDDVPWLRYLDEWESPIRSKGGSPRFSLVGPPVEGMKALTAIGEALLKQREDIVRLGPYCSICLTNHEEGPCP